MKRTTVVSALFLCFISAVLARNLGSGVFPGSTTVSPCDTKNAFQNSQNSILSQNAQDFADMSRFMENASQQTGLHNDCCTGLMQMNQGNLRKFCGCTPEQYAQMSVQQQIDVYGRYFSSTQDAWGMQQLRQMMQSGQTLGGHKIDGITLVACAQMGTGNCAAAVKNGCSSLALGQGGDGHVNVCTMADKVRATADKSRAKAFAGCLDNKGGSGSNGGCPSGPGDFPTTPAPTSPAVSLSA